MVGEIQVLDVGRRACDCGDSPVQIAVEFAEVDGSEVGESKEEAREERACDSDHLEAAAESIGDGKELFGHEGHGFEVAGAVQAIDYQLPAFVR